MPRAGFRLITGGQTGVDQAAWRAAQGLGFATGGAMPRGFLTEDGPQPELREWFHAYELPSPLVEDRTRVNVLASDSTLIVRRGAAGMGTRLTAELCQSLGRPCLEVELEPDRVPAPPEREVARWLHQRAPRVLNVAGDRESVAPGIGAQAERFLLAVFTWWRRLEEGQAC